MKQAERGVPKLPEPVLTMAADRFRLLGEPTRLRLVNELYAEGELSVGDLAERVGISYGAVSRQLTLLRSNGLLRRRREGTRVYHRIGDPSVGELCDAIRNGIGDQLRAWGAELEAEPAVDRAAIRDNGARQHGLGR